MITEGSQSFMSVSDDDDSWGCSCGLYFEIFPGSNESTSRKCLVHFVLDFFQVSSLEFVTNQLCYKGEAKFCDQKCKKNIKYFI